MVYVRFAVRLSVYSAIVAGFCVWLFRMAASEHGGAAFEEGRLIENTQLVLAMLAAGLFGIAAYRWQALRPVLVVAIGLALTATVRECNSLLDSRLPYFGWKGCAAVVLALTGLLVWNRRQELWDNLGPFLVSPAGMLAWVGFLMVVIVAQILGQAEEWRSVMGDLYSRQFKRTVEEMLEALGYLMILLAAGEAMLTSRSLFTRRSEDDPPTLQATVEGKDDAVHSGAG